MALSSEFDRKDIETLIEALGDWEMIGNHDYNLLQAVEDSPMPPDDHEAYDIMVRIKEHYRERKRNILDHRAARQETAVFLKAKLMMVRKNMGINDLFSMDPDVEEAIATTSEVAPVAPIEEVTPETVDQTQPTESGNKLWDKQVEALNLAEFFIKDLGVWDHYEKFLADKRENS